MSYIYMTFLFHYKYFGCFAYCRRLCKATELFVRNKNVFFYYIHVYIHQYAIYTSIYKHSYFNTYINTYTHT